MIARSLVMVGCGFSFVAMLSGCESHPPVAQADEHGPANVALVREFSDQAARNAALSEKSVYPYHFMANESALNELGEAHVQELSAAYKSSPGSLYIAEDDASADLYRARVKAVMQWLSDAGVDVSRITTESVLPGGPGVGSSRAIKSLEEPKGAVRNQPAASENNASR